MWLLDKIYFKHIYGVLGKPQLQPIRFRYLRWNAPRACESDKYFDFFDPSDTNTPLNLRFNLLLGCVLKYSRTRQQRQVQSDRKAEA